MAQLQAVKNTTRRTSRMNRGTQYSFAAACTARQLIFMANIRSDHDAAKKIGRSNLLHPSGRRPTMGAIRVHLLPIVDIADIRVTEAATR